MTIRRVRSTDGADTDDGSTWALAYATIVAAIDASSGGDTVWVSQAHSESRTASVDWDFPAGPLGLNLIVVNDGADPATAYGTQVVLTASTSNDDINFSGVGYVRGFDFQQGSSNNTQVNFAGGDQKSFILDSCNITYSGSGSSTLIRIGNGTSADTNKNIEFRDCTFEVGHRNNLIDCQSGRAKFLRCVWSGSGVLDKIFDASSNNGFELDVDSCDFSNQAHVAVIDLGTQTLRAVIQNCKKHASTALTSGSYPTSPGTSTDLFASALSTGGNAYEFVHENSTGTSSSDTGTYVTSGGASDGTTPVSFNLTGNAATSEHFPLVSREIIQWNDVVSGTLTVNVEIAHDDTGISTLQDDEIWLDVTCMATAGATIGTTVSSQRDTFLDTPANLTGGVAWTGASGYETLTLSAVISPRIVGYISAVVKLGAVTGKTSGHAVFVNPKLSVS